MELFVFFFTVHIYYSISSTNNNATRFKQNINWYASIYLFNYQSTSKIFCLFFSMLYKGCLELNNKYISTIAFHNTLIQIVLSNTLCHCVVLTFEKSHYKVFILIHKSETLPSIHWKNRYNNII